MYVWRRDEWCNGFKEQDNASSSHDWNDFDGIWFY